MAQPAKHKTAAAPIAAPSATSWRDSYRVHPCADVFPMESDEKLEALANDIKEHGLQHPVVLWQDNSSASTSTTWYVLDGRNRLAAVERLGIDIPANPAHARIHGDCPLFRLTYAVTAVSADRFAADLDRALADTISDPAAFVISANIHRRHLTKEQQAELIVKAIAAGRPNNDRAKVARSFSPTSGKRGGSTKDPVLAAAVEEGKRHDISKRTIQTARAKVNGKPAATKATTGSTASAEKATTPSPPPVSAPKPATLARDNKRLRIENERLRARLARAQQDLATALHVADILARGREITAAKQSYKRLVGMLHPDRHPEHESIMREVNVLWQALKVDVPKIR